MTLSINASGQDAAQLLAQLGLAQNVPGQADPIQRQLRAQKRQMGMLRRLLDQFQGAGKGAAGNGLAGGIPPQTLVSPPPCGCGGSGPIGQGGVDQIDIGATPGQPDWTPESRANRQKGAFLEQALTRRHDVRSQLEAMLGGRILNDGLLDGRLTIQRGPFGFSPAGDGFSNPGMDWLNGINGGAQQAFGPQGAQDPFMGMMLGGLTNVLGAGQLLGAPPMSAPIGAGPIGAPIGAAPRRAFTVGDWLNPAGQAHNHAAHAHGNALSGAPVAGNALGGAPVAGNALGGNALAGNAAGGLGGLGGLGGIAGILGDAGLTMEDKIVMLLMQITKGFDRDIENQANRLQQLQQQGQGGNGQTSIDVESMKLKRFIDKRGQMFDMLRQLIDKFNQTQQGMSQSLAK